MFPNDGSRASPKASVFLCDKVCLEEKSESTETVASRGSVVASAMHPFCLCDKVCMEEISESTETVASRVSVVASAILFTAPVLSFQFLM